MEWDASPPLRLGKLCQHNFGHNSIVEESSNAGTIAIFFQHKENYNDCGHTWDLTLVKGFNRGKEDVKKLYYSKTN